jgi:hypothetical protein
MAFETLTRKHIGRAAFLATVLAGGAVAQEAATNGPRGLSGDVAQAERVVVTGVSSRLNIRSGPATDSKIVDHARLGTVFSNKGCETHGARLWCSLVFLDDSGRTGWAAAEFLQPVSARSRAVNGEFDRIGRLECRPVGEADWTRCDYGLARGGQGAAAIVIFVTEETEPLLLWDGTAMWHADDAGDLRLESSEGDDVVRVAPGGHGIAVPKSLLNGL